MFNIGDKVYRVYPGAVMRTKDIEPVPELHAESAEYEVVAAPVWAWWESEEIVWIKHSSYWYSAPIPVFREFLFQTYEDALSCAAKVDRVNESL